jgi:hypothetical protein
MAQLAFQMAGLSAKAKKTLDISRYDMLLFGYGSKDRPW